MEATLPHSTTRAASPTRIAGRAMRLLGSLGLVGVFLMSVLLLVVAVVPELLHYRVMVMTGGSMSPAIDVGDVVLLKQPDRQSIRAGDVVTFNSLGRINESGTTTHRVIATKEIEAALYLQTQGDANPAPDPDLVAAASVYGSVALRVPKAGWVLDWISDPRHRAIFVIAAFLLVAMYELAPVAAGNVPPAQGGIPYRPTSIAGRTAISGSLLVTRLAAQRSSRLARPMGLAAPQTRPLAVEELDAA